ncbi:tetratricopeptide repeat protein [Alteromonas ponticola]|uniref:Tetratricopeptide repeat protein n=1 Tax=Alteromonas aquimaris TaxID=2998417 RepID=A0ABT3P591_9ALTE|nr:tetratricopeptide repeat protein [Alteromonas aquimaris]MCW8107935.1 tetratricopeptide repeat protein [Alteromonas aquimaris]
MAQCRIFVSSPGDVAVERTLVGSVVERLKAKFGHRSHIKLILWEQLPLNASDSFQPQLPASSECELFLLILWKRIGTPLPDSALPDGYDGPITGTEFEFLSALKSQKNKGKPTIWVYRKINPNKKSGLDEVDIFFEKYFLDSQQRLSKAFHQFNTTTDFEYQLEAHLNIWLDENLPTVSDDELLKIEKWQSGNPYLGLKPFRFSQANVFRGRAAAVAESIERLKSKSAQGHPFLLIMGMSGSGKSSLLRAGILPSLYTPQMVPAVKQFYRGIMRPADVQGDPFAGLISALSAKSAGYLIDDDDKPAMLELCKNESDKFIEYLGNALQKWPPHSQLVIGIDQFEELYNASSIDIETQRAFARIVQRLVDQLNVWVVVTLRSDCYHFLTDTPELLELKQDGGQLDLQPPALFNIKQMITEPAELAGLQFEQGHDGELPLDEVIAQSAAKSPESLPLLEFTLSQLYEKRSASGLLTFACYESIGGIEGAIASHAEHVFEQFKPAVKARFSTIFNQLVTSVSDGRYSRHWAYLAELCRNKHSKALVEGFLEARLLVSECNPKGIEVVTLVHESLFRHWPRLAEYLEKNKRLLHLRNEIDQQVKRWLANGKDPALLLNAGKPLEDGKALLKSPLALDKEARQLILLSVKRANYNKRIQWSAVAALVLITLYATWASVSATQSQRIAETSLAKSQDLIGFLVGDLYSQLSKLGRLDVMQSIGQKALNYFVELDPKRATNEDIANRSKTLYQIGSVYIELNQHESALEAFAESRKLLELLTRENPDNYEYLFEYSQATYWVGYTYWLGKHFAKAQQFFEQYLDIANNLVALKPNDSSAKMEVSYALSNLGTMAGSLNKHELAKEYFQASIANSETILAREPDHDDALWSQADANSWLGNAYRKQLDLKKALKYYQDEQRVFKSLVKQSYSYHNRYDLLLATNRILGLKSYLGQYDKALEGYYALLNDIKYLVNHDPDNSRWRHTHVILLADIAKNEFLQGNWLKAKQYFKRSFRITPSLPTNIERIWVDDYAERHYWYWRFLYAQGETKQAQIVGNQIMSLSSKPAKVWQIRYASRSAQPVDFENARKKTDIAGPDALIAYLEYAIANNDDETSRKLASYVPEEMWKNFDLKELKLLLPPKELSLSQQ